MKKLLAVGLAALLLAGTSISAFALNTYESDSPAPPSGTSVASEENTVQDPAASGGSSATEDTAAPESTAAPASPEDNASVPPTSTVPAEAPPASTAPLLSQPSAAMAPFAAATPTFLWANSTTSNSTGVLSLNAWSDTMQIEYPIASTDIPIGGLVFTLSMGADWIGELILGNGSNYFSLTFLGSGVWELANTQILPAENTLALEIEASLDNQVRNLNVTADGSIVFNAITLSYTDPETPVAETLPPLSLTVQTKNDTIAVAKSIKTVGEFPPPGLATDHYADLLTHSFVNWELAVTGTTYTRGFAPGLVLTDALPSVEAGKGSVVSVRINGTIIFKEGDPLPSTGGFTLDANGNVAFAPPAAGSTYSIIVKYPHSGFPSGLLDVTNTAEISGYYKGEPGPADILSSSTSPATDIILNGGQPGGFVPDMSKSYAISVARNLPMGNGGGSALYGGDIFPRNKIAGLQKYTVNINKSLPGNPANSAGSADVAAYIDVMTYGGTQLDTSQINLTSLTVGNLADAVLTNTEVYFKSSVSGSWTATPEHPTAAGVVTVPPGSLYAKVVYKNVAGTGSANIVATYQPTQLLIDQVKNGTLNSEVVLGLYAGLGVFDGASPNVSLFSPILQSRYPVKMISKVNQSPPATNPSDSNALEFMNSYTYNQAEPGVNTLRALTGTRVCDWLFVANSPYATVAWKADTERFEFTAGYTLDMTAEQGSPVQGFTLATYLPENIFLDTDKIYEGMFLAPYNAGEFTSGGEFHAGPIELTMVAVNGVQRQRVVIPLELWENGNPNTPGTWQSKGHNAPYHSIKLPLYTQDVTLYKPGTVVNFTSYLVVAGYSGLSGRFNGTGGFWVKDRHNSSNVWDGAKLTNRDNSIEDWMRIDTSSVTIPNNIVTTFSGVRKYVLDEQNTPVLSTNVKPGKTWKYQIEVVASQGHLKNVVVYDILPASGDTFMGTGNARGSQFNAYFIEADLSAIPAGKRPTIYYSTSATPPNNLASPSWTTTQPPLADIRALAFDFKDYEFIGTDTNPDKAVIQLTVGTNNNTVLANQSGLNSVYSTYLVQRGNGSYTPGLSRDSSAVRATIMPQAANYASIAATVFRDNNNDGILNGTDTGLPNRTVSLYKDGTSPADLVDQATTDMNGRFLFTISGSPGEYFVQFGQESNERFAPFTASTGTYTNINLTTYSNRAAFSYPITIQNTDITTGTVFTRANAAISVWHTLQYDANGGSAAPTDPNSPYLAGSNVQVLGAGTMVRSGYVWTGWNTMANGSGTSYAAGSRFTLNSPTTLYAQWQKETPASSDPPAPPASSNPPASSSRVPSSSLPASSSSSSSSSYPSGSDTSSVPPSSGSGGGTGSTPSSSEGNNNSNGGITPERPNGSQTGNIISDILQNNVPMGSFGYGGAWSLLNLCLALLATFSAILLTAAYLIKTISARNNRAYRPADKTTAPDKETTQNLAMRLIAVFAGIATMVLFLILEDLTLPYVFINKWTPLILTVFLLHAASLIVFALTRKKEPRSRYTE